MVIITVRVRIRFSVWLVSGYAHVFRQLPVVTVRPSLRLSVCTRCTLTQLLNENSVH